MSSTTNCTRALRGLFDRKQANKKLNFKEVAESFGVRRSTLAFRWKKLATNNFLSAREILAIDPTDGRPAYLDEVGIKRLRLYVLTLENLGYLVGEIGEDSVAQAMRVLNAKQQRIALELVEPPKPTTVKKYIKLAGLSVRTSRQDIAARKDKATSEFISGHFKLLRSLFEECKYLPSDMHDNQLLY